MKKVLVLLMAIFVALSLCSCDTEYTASTEDTICTEDTADTTFNETNQVTETEKKTEEEQTPSRPIPQNVLRYGGESEAFSTNVIGTTEITKDKIMSITFLDTLADMPADAWDASQDKNGSVMAWVDGDFNLFIAGEGGVTAPVSCNGMFRDYYNAEYINFNNCFYTDLVEDMRSMFASSDGIRELDLSFFNTSNVRNMRAMFSYCTRLNSVDLSSFDTSKVYDMRMMFQLTSLDSLDLSSFNTSKVNDMHYMFEYCDELTTLDLSNFDTSKVTNMKGMFGNCESLTSLNVTSFNTSNVTDMSDMFTSCKSLSKVDLSSFDFSSVQKADEMFAYNKNLTDIGCTIVLPEGCTSEKMYFSSGLE